MHCTRPLSTMFCVQVPRAGSQAAGDHVGASSQGMQQGAPAQVGTPQDCMHGASSTAHTGNLTVRHTRQLTPHVLGYGISSTCSMLDGASIANIAACKVAMGGE